jgi:hypothetical protein
MNVSDEKDRTSDTSTSKSSTPPLALIDQYQKIVQIWSGIVDDLDEKLTTVEDSKALERAREARRFFDNTRSLFLSWGCDIRVDSGGLEGLQDTAVALPVRAAFDDIDVYLAGWSEKCHDEPE